MSSTTPPRTASTGMKAWLVRLQKNCVDTIARNAGLLTGFTVAFILATGLTLNVAPDLWWIPATLVAVSAVVFFIFANARVLFKVVVAVIVTIIASSLSFQMGVMMNPYSGAPLLWFSSYWFVFFLALSFSYWYIRGRSRWGSLILSVFLSFCVAYVVGISTLSSLLSALSTIVVGVLTFVLAYTMSRKTRYSMADMPININTATIEHNIVSDARKHGYHVRLVKNDTQEYYLVWKERAYAVLPVVMDENFGLLTTRRGKSLGLSYHDRSVNPWLIDQVFNKTLSWKKGATDAMLILVDVKEANNKNPGQIMVQLPDTKKSVIVGITDGGMLLDKNMKKSFVSTMDDTFKEFAHDLSEDDVYRLLNMENKKSLYINDVDEETATTDDSTGDTEGTGTPEGKDGDSVSVTGDTQGSTTAKRSRKNRRSNRKR